VTLVAALGLALNIAVAWLLMHGEQTMNTRGALLHVLGDLLGSVAALVSGAIVMWTGWMTADPLLSLVDLRSDAGFESASAARSPAGADGRCAAQPV
jgi:Co/Zn/Cd efflux system component